MRRHSLVPRAVAPFALALGLSATASAAVDQPAVQQVPGENVVLWLEIPDLRALVGRIESVSETFAKAAGADDATVAQALGQAIGPQELDALTPGAPVVLVVLKPAAGAIPDAAWFVPVKEAATFTQAALRWHQQAAVAADDVLILAQTAQAAERAKAALPTYRALAAAPAKTDVRVHIAVARAMTQWGQMATFGIGSAAAMAGAADPKNGQSLAAMITVELDALLAMVGQIDEAELDITARDDAFALRWTNAAKPGSPLAAAMRTMKDGANPAAALLPPGPATIAMTARFDAPAMTALVRSVIDAVAKDPAAKAMLAPAMTDAAMNLLAAQDGDIAMRAVFSADHGMRETFASSIHDPHVIDTARTLITAAFTGDSQLAKLYAGMGVTLAVTPAARQHAGVAIDETRFTIDETRVPPEQAALMSSMMPDFDTAATDRWWLGATTPAVLDTLIDATKAAPAATGVPITRAERVHGGGAAVYVDYDIVEAMRAMLTKMTPGFAIPAGQHEPLTVAIRWQDGVAANDVRVPFDTITTLIKAAANHAAAGEGDAEPAPTTTTPTF